MSDSTHLPNSIDSGDPHAAAQLLPVVYDELQSLAAQELAHEMPGQTLVYGAYLRLIRMGDPPPGVYYLGPEVAHCAIS